jgi:N-acetylglutamate synthase-like GNAT family acetyltransferase
MIELEWIQECPPVWDAEKRRIVGGAPEGAFKVPGRAPGELLPGDWWRAERDGVVVGYGWMDTTWGGDAEILLAVAPDARGAGAGTFILEQLEREAAHRGLNYLYNVVAPTHPDAAGVTAWLERRRFKASHEGRLMRKVLRVPR